MKRKLLDCLAVIVVGATFGATTPAMAFRGGFGGAHGGFGGAHVGIMHGGGAHFVGGMVAGRPVFAPMAHRFGGGHFAFNHHFRRARNVVVFGAPFAVYGGAYAYGDWCWRQVSTSYGWRWVDICPY